MTDADLDYHVWPPLSERGGQQVGRYTGVLVVHRETGYSVACESERSRHGNREKATARLREVLARMASAAEPVDHEALAAADRAVTAYMAATAPPQSARKMTRRPIDPAHVPALRQMLEDERDDLLHIDPVRHAYTAGVVRARIAALEAALGEESPR